MRRHSLSKRQTWMLWVALSVLILLGGTLFAQTIFAHRTGTAFLPDYPMVDLGPILAQDQLTDDDYDTILLQTGLGRPAADLVRSAGEAGTAVILQAQRAFFANYQMDCVPLLGWFTREDHLVDTSGVTAYGPPLVDLQPGDVLITRSTHSMGWRHGHAGLVVETEEGVRVLESVSLGTNSTVVSVQHWRDYSNFAVLRVKGASADECRTAADTALDELLDTPYHLTAGLFGNKAPEPDATFFGLHCSYLVWYAWNRVGYDLDSDGGKLVTTNDLLYSDQLELVQLYGMDPRGFLN